MIIKFILKNSKKIIEILNITLKKKRVKNIKYEFK